MKPQEITKDIYDVVDVWLARIERGLTVPKVATLYKIASTIGRLWNCDQFISYVYNRKHKCRLLKSKRHLCY